MDKSQRCNSHQPKQDNNTNTNDSYNNNNNNNNINNNNNTGLLNVDITEHICCFSEQNFLAHYANLCLL